MRIPPPHTGGRFPRDSILKAVEDEPGLGVRDIARTTGHSGITVSKHLAALRQSGELEAVLDGKKRLHYPAGKARPKPVHLPEGWSDILAVLDDLPVTFPGLHQ